jgi:hypothetical protein
VKEEAASGVTVTTRTIPLTGYTNKKKYYNKNVSQRLLVLANRKIQRCSIPERFLASDN